MIITKDITIENIFNDIDHYIDLFLEQGVLVFKELNPTRQEEWDLMKAFGDHIGWFPNSSVIGEPRSPYLSLEDETHEMTFKRHEEQERFSNQLFIDWHMENIEKQNYQTGALWHMRKFECSKEVGVTGFVNMLNFFDQMPIEWQEFLLDCLVTCLIHADKNGFYTDVKFSEFLPKRKPVINHYTLNKPILRFTLSGTDILVKYKNAEPSKSNILLFNEIQQWVINQVIHTQKNQYWHYWDVGDTLIVDLSLMAHAVTGGFKLGERYFSRIWAHRFSMDMIQ